MTICLSICNSLFSTNLLNKRSWNLWYLYGSLSLRESDLRLADFLWPEFNVTYRLAKLNSIFKNSSKVCLCHSHNADAVALFHVLDPAVRLPLRIDHERPATGRPDKTFFILIWVMHWKSTQLVIIIIIKNCAFLVFFCPTVTYIVLIPH